MTEYNQDAVRVTIQLLTI